MIASVDALNAALEAVGGAGVGDLEQLCLRGQPLAHLTATGVRKRHSTEAISIERPARSVHPADILHSDELEVSMEDDEETFLQMHVVHNRLRAKVRQKHRRRHVRPIEQRAVLWKDAPASQRRLVDDDFAPIVVHVGNDQRVHPLRRTGLVQLGLQRHIDEHQVPSRNPVAFVLVWCPRQRMKFPPPIPACLLK